MGGRNVGGNMVENEFRPPRLWWQIGSSSRDEIKKESEFRPPLHFAAVPGLSPLLLPSVLPRSLSSILTYTYFNTSAARI